MSLHLIFDKGDNVAIVYPCGREYLTQVQQVLEDGSVRVHWESAELTFTQSGTLLYGTGYTLKTIM